MRKVYDVLAKRRRKASVLVGSNARNEFSHFFFFFLSYFLKLFFKFLAALYNSMWILVYQSGIESESSRLEAGVLNHWPSWTFWTIISRETESQPEQRNSSLKKSKAWRRKWQPTPVFLPGESQGWGSLVGCRLWGRRVRHDWRDLAAAAAVSWWASQVEHIDCGVGRLSSFWGLAVSFWGFWSFWVWFSPGAPNEHEDGSETAESVLTLQVPPPSHSSRIQNVW